MIETFGSISNIILRNYKAVRSAKIISS